MIIQTASQRSLRFPLRRAGPDPSDSPLQVLPCKCTEDHNHAVCPYAHPLEKARRRDVRAIAYIDAACPDFRKARRLLSPHRTHALMPCGGTSQHSRAVRVPQCSVEVRRYAINVNDAEAWRTAYALYSEVFNIITAQACCRFGLHTVERRHILVARPLMVRHPHAGFNLKLSELQGTCKRGELCPFAHGVFEAWLHPARYRTQACRDGAACGRPICFFAHRYDICT